jgi:hypothetical protein
MPLEAGPVEAAGRGGPVEAGPVEAAGRGGPMGARRSRRCGSGGAEMLVPMWCVDVVARTCSIPRSPFPQQQPQRPPVRLQNWAGASHDPFAY